MEEQYKQLVFKIVSQIRDLVYDEQTKVKSRTKPQYFTRDRKLPFPVLLIFLMAKLPGSLDTELQVFFSKEFPEMEPPSEAALSKARSHITEWPFKEIFDIIQDCYLEFQERTGSGAGKHGLVPVSFDGSQVSLPNFPQMRQAYGGSGRNKSSPAARMEIGCNSKTRFIYLGVLATLKLHETKLAKELLKELSKKMRPEEVEAIFDRTYTDSGFFKFMSALGFNFLARVREKFHGTQELDDETLTCVHLKDPVESFRVGKTVLKPGEKETLATNLKGPTLERLKQDYSLRWTVKGVFYFLKHDIRLEDFNGYSGNSVKQDFWIALSLSNIVFVIMEGARLGIEERRSGKGNKYKYQSNASELVSSLHLLIVEALLTEDDIKRRQCVDKMFEKAERYVCPV